MGTKVPFISIMNISNAKKIQIREYCQEHSFRVTDGCEGCLDTCPYTSECQALCPDDDVIPSDWIIKEEVKKRELVPEWCIYGTGINDYLPGCTDKKVDKKAKWKLGMERCCYCGGKIKVV